MRMKNFLLMCLLTLLGSAVFAQTQTIKGTVVDATDDSPLVGVTVVVVGTFTGAITDADGNFSVEAKPGQILRFNLTGVDPKEVTLGNETFIKVVLETSNSLIDEVVVTALGQKEDKRSLTYATTEIKGSDIYETGRENFGTALAGRVAGLSMTPSTGMAGASVSLQLRGPSSIDGNNQPLIVVDGLPMDNRTFNQGALVSDQPNRTADFGNRAADINPADIETITVLKGPEAAALYGIDASSGAIIITTKKGVKGKGRINYDNLFRTEELFRFPKVDQNYYRGINGDDDPQNTVFMGSRVPEGTPIYDNVGNFFQRGFTQTHNLGFEGGTEAVSYRFSTSYTDQDGVVPTNEFTRYIIRASSRAQIRSNLTADISYNFTNTILSAPLRGAQGFMISLYNWPGYDDAAVYLNPDGSRRKLQDATTENDNPFFSVYKNQTRNQTKNNLINTSLSYDATKWLNITGRLGVNFYNTIGNRLWHPESVLGLTGAGSIETFNESSTLLNGNLLATAKKTFGDFKFAVTAGGTFDDRNYEVTSARGERLSLPEFMSINNTDPFTQQTKLTITRHRLLSVLGTFNIDYKKLAYLRITGRNDWTSTLPVGNNTFFYPSVGAGLVLSELSFLKDNKVLTFVKLRATYAQTGKDAPPYRIRPRLVVQTTTGGGFGYDIFGGNPNLVPERTQSYETGLELQFFKQRIGLDITYFNLDRFDQIVAQRLSYGTGFIFGLVNGGTFNTQGLEVQMNVTPVKKTRFSWDINANLTQFTTKVISLPANQSEFYNSDTWIVSRASSFVSNLQEYYPKTNLSGNQRGLGSATAIAGNSYLRNEKGQILINPTTGLPIINNDYLPIGDRNPDFTIGLNNQFTIGDFSLSFLLDFRRGGDVYNGTEQAMFNRGLSARIPDRAQPYVFKGVLRDGRENSENPTANTIGVTPQYRSDFFSALPHAEFVEYDVNWMRLRDITLSYGIPAKILDRRRILRNARIFVTATDLFLLTNYTGADPNVSGNNASTRGVGGAGMDYFNVAVPRTVSGGVRLGF